MAAAFYGGMLGAPAIFERSCFPDLAALAGDEGARGLLRREAAKVVPVPMPEAAQDVDTAGDEADARRRAGPAKE